MCTTKQRHVYKQRHVCNSTGTRVQIKAHVQQNRDTCTNNQTHVYKQTRVQTTRDTCTNNQRHAYKLRRQVYKQLETHVQPNRHACTDRDTCTNEYRACSDPAAIALLPHPAGSNWVLGFILVRPPLLCSCIIQSCIAVHGLGPDPCLLSGCPLAINFSCSKFSFMAPHHVT